MYLKSEIRNPNVELNPKSQCPMSRPKFGHWSLVIGHSFVIGILSLVIYLSNSFAEQLSSKEYVSKAWEAWGKRNYEETYRLTQECVDLYSKEAKRQQATLDKFPPSGRESIYQELNDVGTCLFIRGEALLSEGKTQEAKEAFNTVLKDYGFAQAWDPRGWFWSVAEKSRATLDKTEGAVSRSEEPVKPKTPLHSIERLVLSDPGKEELVDYAKYGKFIGVGSKDYKYELTDQTGLSVAVGEGIYPNTNSVLYDPEFQRYRKKGYLEGSHWDFVDTDDTKANFYKWATTPEPWGVKLFFIGQSLERAGLLSHAIKAYYAIIVHFPKVVAWTYWHTPWYPSQAAIAKINFILRQHPELQMRLEGASVRITNGFDNNVNNDTFIVNPGKLVKEPFIRYTYERFKKATTRKNLGEPKKILGLGAVRLVQFKNGHWRLMVAGKPYVIKGITYGPTKVGQSPDNKTLTSWMEYDFNHNGKADGPYDSFVDKNHNNLQDKNEPAVGDFRLLKEMGVNTIRLYHQPFSINKEILRDLYKRFGVRVIMGDFLGKYALGSGASWYEGTDYSNPAHQKNMLESVTRMVLEFKDEPYILMWLLGNENNYGVACNADKDPESFYKFVDKAAVWIKSLDKNHPVAIANGDTLYLDAFAKNAPNVDAFGANVYRGDYGFGYFWQAVGDQLDKPVFITEYGCPAYQQGKSQEEAETSQAQYLKASWEDIAFNMAGGEGSGNAIGGVLFEWLDEWWKAYEPSIHDSKGLFRGPFPGGFMYEEWLGISGQGNGGLSPFLRGLRKSYYVYKKMWR